MIGRRNTRRGLSTMEVVLSTALVGLIAAGALRSVGGVFRTRAAADAAGDGTGLAQALMAEVLQSRYEDPAATIAFGPESGETDRADFNDVDDYQNWTESPPRTRDDTPLAGYTGWQRTVQIALVAPATLQNSSSDQGLKRIVVTATDPAGRSTTCTSYRSRWGAGEQTPDAPLTIQTWVGSQIQTSRGAAAISGVNLTNHAQDR